MVSQNNFLFPSIHWIGSKKLPLLESKFGVLISYFIALIFKYQLTLGGAKDQKNK